MAVGSAARETSNDDNAGATDPLGSEEIELKIEESTGSAVVTGARANELAADVSARSATVFRAGSIWERADDNAAGSTVAAGLAANDVRIEDNAGTIDPSGLADNELRIEESTGSAVARGPEASDVMTNPRAGVTSVVGVLTKELKIAESEATGKVLDGSAANELNIDASEAEGMFKPPTLIAPDAPAVTSAVTPPEGSAARSDETATAAAVGIVARVLLLTLPLGSDAVGGTPSPGVGIPGEMRVTTGVEDTARVSPTGADAVDLLLISEDTADARAERRE